MKKILFLVIILPLLAISPVFGYSAYLREQLDQLEEVDRTQRGVYGGWQADAYGDGYIYKDNQGTYGELRKNQFNKGYTYRDNQGSHYEITPNPYSHGYDIRGH